MATAIQNANSVQQEPRRLVLVQKRTGVSHLWVVGVALVFTVALYLLPYLITIAKMGRTYLPPVVGVDEMLYLNLSTIQHSSTHTVINPWYGTEVSKGDVPHLHFPINFILFHFVQRIFRSLTVAMLVWAGLWAALTFLSAIFCMQSLVPDADQRWITFGALGLLVLQSPLVYFAALVRLPSMAGLLSLELPFLRFAIPQVMLPFVLTYLGIQARFLEGGSKRLLAFMAALQFAVCATFPYFLPVLACGTGVTFVLFKISQETSSLTWASIVVFGGVCGLLDVGYLLIAGFTKSHANIQFAVRFRPEVLLPAVRPFVLLLIAGAVLAMISGETRATRTTVAGLALGNALFGFSDAFFPPAAQILDHPYYIIALTTSLPLLVFGRRFLANSSSRAKLGMTLAVVALGCWESVASYCSNAAVNAAQVESVRQIKTLSLKSSDLVVAPAQHADDLSSWIPLVSPARTLYTPDAENILSSDQTRTDHVFRQAAYLAMTGMTVAALSDAVADNSRSNWLAQQGDRAYQRSHVLKDRLVARARISQRLSPLIDEFQNNPASLRAFLSGYERVIVIGDERQRFQLAILSKWLAVDQAFERNGIQVFICHAKSA